VVTRFQGAIFDVDGVLVDSPHQKAWQQSLRELMNGEWSGIRGQTAWSPGAFTPHLYQSEISGMPRMSGARAALEYFQVPGTAARAAQYAAHKQAMVVRLIEAGDFTAYPDALRFIIAVKDAGIRVAAASSSKNAKLNPPPLARFGTAGAASGHPRIRSPADGTARSGRAHSRLIGRIEAGPEAVSASR
jgi:beta-phosphoglucomutase-like phosphatase (HAD superfamily)